MTIIDHDKAGKETARREMCECHVARPTRYGFPAVRLDDFCALHVDAKTAERTFAGLAPTAGAKPSNNLHTPRRRGTGNGWRPGKTGDTSTTNKKGTSQMKDEKNTNAAAETAEEEKNKEVLTRFTPSELEVMRKDTGASKNATAIASYVRKRLAAEGANA